MRRNSLAEIPRGVSYHIWSSHKTFFLDPPLPPSNVNSIAVALDDTGSFRSAVERLPLANKAKIITGVQMVRIPINRVPFPVFKAFAFAQCIDNCLMDAAWTGERLQLLVDLSSSSGLFPEAYWMTGVAKEECIAYGDEVHVYRGRHSGRAVAVREHRVSRSELYDPQQTVQVQFKFPILRSS
jgi:hypothetical protein